MLDHFLAKGWFRMGQSIFTSQFLCVKDEVYSTVWIRQPLENYTFKKRLRKLIRQNKDRFQLSLSKAFIDEETEALYSKHRNRFDSPTAFSLQEALQEDRDINVFDTWKFEVRDAGKLIAASFFDEGATSIASITGIFDPDYHKFSLGLFTMLLEIEYAQMLHKRFYYPGYVVPGYATFDYKLRIGDVQFFKPRSHSWHSLDQLPQEPLPDATLKLRLEEWKALALENNIQAQIFVYPLFYNGTSAAQEEDLIGTRVNSPLLICCTDPRKSHNVLVVEFDMERKKYLLSDCLKLFSLHATLTVMAGGYDLEKSIGCLLERDTILAQSRTAGKIMTALKKVLES